MSVTLQGVEGVLVLKKNLSNPAGRSFWRKSTFSVLDFFESWNHPSHGG